jgi:probable HAF family extracellular repeat protein
VRTRQKEAFVLCKFWDYVLQRIQFFWKTDSRRSADLVQKIEGTQLKAMRAIHLSWGAAVSQAARLTALAVLVAAVGSVPAVQAKTPTYTIVPLGLADPSDPASIILPIAINDLGVVVGFAYRTNELPEALRWFKGTSTVLQPLPVEPPYNQSLAQPRPINNHDEIVGTDLLSGQTSVQASAIWPASGGVFNLSALITGQSWATAINNAGQVVGYNKAPVTAGGPVHYRAFLYQNGAVTMLPPPETTGDSWADGINDSGVIIGTANFGTT